MPDIHIDLDALNKQMEKFKEEFPKDKKHFKFYQFDDENFKKKMKELEKKLEDLKKQKMKKLEKELQEKLRGLENYKFHFQWKEDEDTEV
jgi:predicted nuclease with TOPRIM domain